MDQFNAKELKKLADACRKAGIKSFKGFGMEFTLTDDLPASNYKKAKAAEVPPLSSDNVETDSLTDEQLLMWSAGDYQLS